MSRRAAAALVALLAVLALAGCSQEGRLVQSPLPARGVAMEFIETHRGGARDTTQIHTSVVYGRFKILVHASNPCEAANTTLQLRRFDNPTLYEITPVARYNADDACVSRPPAVLDTAQTLKVNGVLMLGPQAYGFRVLSAGGPAFD